MFLILIWSSPTEETSFNHFAIELFDNYDYLTITIENIWILKHVIWNTWPVAKFIINYYISLKIIYIIIHINIMCFSTMGVSA